MFSSCIPRFTHCLFIVFVTVVLWLEASSSYAEPISLQQSAQRLKELNPSDDLLSLDFQDIPIRNALQWLASNSGINIVVSDQVTGNLSIRLENVEWAQALDTILHAKHLVKRIQGNVIVVTTQEEDKQYLARLAQNDKHTRVYRLQYANVADVAGLITMKKSGESQSQALLSDSGSFSVDHNTATLLVTDSEENLQAIDALISTLDKAKKQVQIEARIVSIKEGNLDELGVKWSYNSIGQIEGANNFDVDALANNDIDSLFNINLPATTTGAASLAFQVAQLGAGALLDLELSALQRESKAEIISTPRLITTELKPAYIEQGTEIPYTESSSSGATSVSFKKAVLSLKVTPKIMPDHRVLLDIDVTQDHPGDVVKTGTGEAVAVNTQKIGTQVLVNDGATVVLGGIHQHSVTETTEKVPFFGDLPLIGALFRRHYKQKTKSELMIFVTPKVLYPKMNVTKK
ncbi:type IV pilus secretin PilQ [Vibrio sp. S4M6]|uniref:type IV pilus secretin PilQ n=1 Tax=Vibrio sinus TaxID=2946865 RepID=UPI00202A4ABA|nr:type IV pilus secretin PilQ [Vibrio sinus]MCL9780434.1 type IV pilus secretin PilQ [Vibrio sinus]